MARLRQNHNKEQGGKLSMRFIVFGLFLIFLFLYMGKWLKVMDFPKTESSSSETDPVQEHFFLPTSNGQVIHHSEYSLSYLETHEQAEWVAYRLTRKNLKKPNVKRTGRFNPDYSVTTRSAFHRDYSGSGFTRGHLAPAGDMAHSNKAMEESFYMSNISPQLRPFNNGIWKELEEQVRDWAFSTGSLIVVTGPVLTDSYLQKIGQNRVSVPRRFYKIILDIDQSNERSIAFIIPNQRIENPLQEYVVSIDSIENLIGIDFFPELLNDEEEEKLESMTMSHKWKFSDERYKLRIQKWNYQ